MQFCPHCCWVIYIYSLLCGHQMWQWNTIYRKRRKFGVTLIWQIWWIEGIHQILIHQLVIFILFTIGCTVNLPNFLQPKADLPNFSHSKLSSFMVFRNAPCYSIEEHYATVSTLFLRIVLINLTLVITGQLAKSSLRNPSCMYGTRKVHTHTHTHTSKVYSSHMKHSYCCPVNQHWDAYTPLRHLNFVQANPLGARLVTRRRTVQVSWREVAEPKVPQWPQYH